MNELIIPIIILLWTIKWFMIGVLCESFYRDLFGKSLSNKEYKGATK